MIRKWIIVLVVICVSAVSTEFINFIKPNEVNTTVLVETQSTSIETPTAKPTSSPTIKPTVTPTIEPTETIDPTPIRTAPNVSVKTDIDPEILDYLILRSTESGYSLELLQGMIQLESSCTWDPNFIDNQDYGLMQINICNHAHLREAFKDKYPEFDILNYKTNIDCGIYMLDVFKQSLERRLGRNPTELEVLTAYNKGPYYVETKGIYEPYVNKVLEYKEQYKIWNTWRDENALPGLW